MPYQQLNRNKLLIKSLRDRKNKVNIERDCISADTPPKPLSKSCKTVIEETIGRIIEAKKRNRPVILAFGAHSIKNGLAPVFIKLMEDGWVTHLATNGAGIIHDWEFSFQGQSSEDVKANVCKGEFGIWEETGFYINLAIIVGAYNGLGYGESVGAMIHNEGLDIPKTETLKKVIKNEIDKSSWKAAAAIDLLETIRLFNLKSGRLNIPHPFKKYSVQAASYRLKIPFTGHPMIGCDIIYTHPINHGAAIGRTALTDFLIFANAVSDLECGVYLSVGSAVMSPMIFEKSFSMAQNLAIQKGKHIDNHYMVVVDLAESDWDWKNSGEPPSDNPAYYLRYCKSFSRMGGIMRYCTADNRDFLLALCQGLQTTKHTEHSE